MDSLTIFVQEEVARIECAVPPELAGEPAVAVESEPGRTAMSGICLSVALSLGIVGATLVGLH